MARRLVVLRATVVLLCLLVLGRLVQLQVIEGNRNRELADENHIRVIRRLAPRAHHNGIGACGRDRGLRLLAADLVEENAAGEAARRAGNRRCGSLARGRRFRPPPTIG